MGNHPENDRGRLGHTGESWPNWLKKDDGNKDVGNEDPASGPVTRWGNHRWEDVGGYYRLDHGPKGPADKPYFTTPELD